MPTLGIPTRNVNGGQIFDQSLGLWRSVYADLPIVGEERILLVPKWAARYDLSYDCRKYYRGFVLEYLKYEEIRQNTNLVRLLKYGRRKGLKDVKKKDLEKKYPFSKEFLYQISSEAPELLDRYKEYLKQILLVAEQPLGIKEELTEERIAETLQLALNNTLPGGEAASNYHMLASACLEFLFYPNLIHPTVEAEILDGRKRLDIVFDNNSTDGPFFVATQQLGLSGLHVVVECKNYSRDIGNPEIDQLAGRFSRERGQIGIACFRNTDDKELLIVRCNDTLRDGRGLILPFDDGVMIEMLERVKMGRRSEIYDIVWRTIRQVQGIG